MNKGIVVKSTGSWCDVEYSGKIISCKIKGKFRIQGIKTTNPVAVGDEVEFEINKEDNTGVIYKISERKNYIIRKSINLSREAHILAANIDIAFLVVSLKKPKTYPVFIDRFLVTCEAYKIKPIIIFNKLDLYGDAENKILEEYNSIYKKIGYECINISVETGLNIDQIQDTIKNNVILIAGNSGVGKSSLINAVQPGLTLKTSSVSGHHNKGKHTTTFAEMFAIGEGKIIDTPGIKGLGLVDMEKEEIHHYFPEMFRLLKDCKYNNCTHLHEPGCAVKEALLKDEISEIRYKSYLSIIDDDDNRIRTDVFRS